MISWLYRWAVYPLFHCLVWGYGLFHQKTRATLRLRSERKGAGGGDDRAPIEYWVHVASQGELEYALPVIRELGLRGKNILLTYYSISARGPATQVAASLANVSHALPLPHDGFGDMRAFARLARSRGVARLLLMKYELWPGLLWECGRQGIKVFLVDALKPGWAQKPFLGKVEGILSGYGSELEGVRHPFPRVVGDTRVERVTERARAAGSLLLKEALPAGFEIAAAKRETLVCGSMWPKDSTLVLSGLRRFLAGGGECNVIWVPHELEEREGERVAREFRGLGFDVAMLAGEASVGQLSTAPAAVIVMRKGILAELYRRGRAAYVGGGFGRGIHSVWEPALAGAQVACGPRTDRSPESRELESAGWLTRTERPPELAAWLPQALAPPAAGARERLAQVVDRHLGAAKRIVEICEGMK